VSSSPPLTGTELAFPAHSNANGTVIVVLFLSGWNPVTMMMTMTTT